MSEDNLHLFKTQKGGLKVQRNGFAYMKNRQCGNKVYWYCEALNNSMYKCRARLITLTEGESLSVLSSSGEHNHEPNPIRASVANNISELKSNTKHQRMAKTCQIVQEHIASTSMDIASNLPSKDAIRQIVNREKKKLFNTKYEPTTFDFNIQEDATMLEGGNNFVIKDKIFGSDKRVILLSTKKLMTFLAEALYWVMDGTFKIVPAVFQQLYTIHGPVLNSNKTFPLLFVLCTHKDKASYDVMFGLIIDYCSENNISLNPSFVIMDFEKAARLSLRQHFESVTIKGCFFHLRQIIYRRIQKEGLSIKYNNDQSFNIDIKSISALAYIHPQNIPAYYNALIQSLSDDDALKIAEWFGQNYVIGKNNQPPQYNPSFWCCCNIPNIPRTQNSAESFHHHINQISAKRHIGFYRLVAQLIKETEVNNVYIVKLQNGEPEAKKRKQKNEQKLQRIDNILKNITDYTYSNLLRAIASNL